MDFIPRYAHPFTFAEAVKLDVPIITEEITRLQNSLQHLRKTQTGLQEYIDAERPEDVDPEITKALEENVSVIASQEERILLLKLALSQKGVPYGSHYDLEPGAPQTQSADHTQSTQPTPHPETTTESHPPDDEVDGIHL
ncbi:hypothetical protein H0H87_009648 [Tephrocybe sp. NHM501043]|nr:hypothetical protein H0H87_009648 [Tephrocybe sp. NHM501043]